MVKVHKEKKDISLKWNQDKCYRSNFWKTAKDITNGTFGNIESAPTFDKTKADIYYKTQYENPVKIDIEKLDWFPAIENPTVSYNISPYKPKDIKAALLNKKKSAPGYDAIVYDYLLNMPFLHQSLATAFTRIRGKGIAPKSWGESRMILIKKDSEASDNNPRNFRMISLTLNIGELFIIKSNQRVLFVKCTDEPNIYGYNSLHWGLDDKWVSKPGLGAFVL